MQDDWDMVQRQPDACPPPSVLVPGWSTSQGPGRDGTCGSLVMRLHTGTARRTATRPVLEETQERGKGREANGQAVAERWIYLLNR